MRCAFGGVNPIREKVCEHIEVNARGARCVDEVEGRAASSPKRPEERIHPRRTQDEKQRTVPPACVACRHYVRYLTAAPCLAARSPLHIGARRKVEQRRGMHHSG